MATQKRILVGLIVAVGVSLLAILGSGLKNGRERTERYREGIRRLREQYPLESLVARLPASPRLQFQRPLSEAAEATLVKFEKSITGEIQINRREEKLQQLHEGTIEE